MSQQPKSEKAIERELIFANLLNGVPPENVAQAFNKESVAQVMDEFRYVALKIKSYMFSRAMPYIPLDTIAEAMQNKLQALDLLTKVKLDALPAYKQITAVKLEDTIK